MGLEVIEEEVFLCLLTLIIEVDISWVGVGMVLVKLLNKVL